MCIGADYSFEVKNFEFWVPAFFKHDNLFLATVRFHFSHNRPFVCLFYFVLRHHKYKNSKNTQHFIVGGQMPQESSKKLLRSVPLHCPLQGLRTPNIDFFSKISQMFWPIWLLSIPIPWIWIAFHKGVSSKTSDKHILGPHFCFSS